MTNSAYTGMKKEELEKNDELLFYLALFIANNYHLLSVDNRFCDLNHRLLVRYLWGKLLPASFNKHVNNFLSIHTYSSNKNNLEKSQILKKYCAEAEKFNELKESLSKNFQAIKYICNVTFASLYYGNNEKGQGINFKVMSDLNEYCNEVNANFC